ncbi:MAG TPA: hypothetical protein VEU96_15335 [Bryobacteraceae bacterium]|nr:hypothetical protein [Bryobacteraceae bacterium]
MNTIRKSLYVTGLALVALLLATPGWLSAQTFTPTSPNPDAGLLINPPPFDFNDNFYTANGINVSQLNTAGAGRFGTFRQTGPPAGPGQFNWVVDNSNTDPDRRNVRILATTGGYIDDGTGAGTQFISLIAFMLDQTFFTGVANARGIHMVDIIGDFEAYAALKQKQPDGTFLTQPCLASIGVTTNCFSVASVATPNLRQDWRFATNRNGIDGSSGQGFGYFCDDILGAWIITYFYFTDAAVGPHPTALCQSVLKGLVQKNGTSLDGTPIIKTADELNLSLEANGCGAEFQLDQGGADGGPVWLICPAIPDPKQGGIAQDAFPDVVRLPNGNPLAKDIFNNFVCLQNTGQYCKPI